MSRGGSRGDRDRDANKDSSRIPKRSEFRVEISSVPSQTSWQDIKDFLRPEGKSVCFAEIKDDIAFAEFEVEEDLKNCVERLDGKTIKGKRGVEGVVYLKQVPAVVPAGSRGVSGTATRDGGRSPVKEEARARSRSRSPAPAKKDRSRSRSRDREDRDDDDDGDRRRSRSRS